MICEPISDAAGLILDGHGRITRATEPTEQRVPLPPHCRISIPKLENYLGSLFPALFCPQRVNGADVYAIGGYLLFVSYNRRYI